MLVVLSIFLALNQINHQWDLIKKKRKSMKYMHHLGKVKMVLLQSEMDNFIIKHSNLELTKMHSFRINTNSQHITVKNQATLLQLQAAMVAI